MPAAWWRQSGNSVSTYPISRPRSFCKTTAWSGWANVPVRIEILTRVSGVEFEACYGNRVEGEMDGVEVSLIILRDLLANKRASGRHKDLMDVEELSGE